MPGQTDLLTGLSAVIYVRISSDRSKEGAGLGVARQEEDCRELAARLGLTIIAVLSDNDISAYSGKPRPGYRKLLEMIAAGEVSVVLAWHTDRLHRRLADLEEYITLCEEHDTATHTVKAGNLDLATPAGRLFARQLGSFAQYDIEQMKERMKRAHLQSAHSGKWAGGKRPFGFAADGVTHIPAEAAAILAGTRAVLEGASLKSIAREWNDAGLTGTEGAPWSGRHVAPILLRARNAGLRTHKGKETGQAKWDAIVPEELWRACKLRLDAESRRTTTGPDRRWLGTGLYLCGICEEPLTRGRGGPQRARAPVYRCGRGTGPHVQRIAYLLDEYVTSVLLDWAKEQDFTRPAPKVKDDVGHLHAQIAAGRERLNAAGRMYQQDVIDAGQLAEITAEEKRASALLEARIAAAADVSPFTPLRAAGPVRETWDGLGISRQRAILEKVMTVVVQRSPRGRPAGWRKGDTYFDADSIEIRWHDI